MPQLLLLHGFLGAPESFSDLVRRLPAETELWAPPLLGHAGCPLHCKAQTWPEPFREQPAAAPEPTTFWEEVDRLAHWATRAGFVKGTVLGYSLGGRIALGLVARHPQLFHRVITIGAHPGLATREERAARIQSDGNLIVRLSESSTAEFVREWEALPLFQSQGRLPLEVLAAQRRLRQTHSPHGLCQSLRVCGLGTMPLLHEALYEIAVPIDLVAGQLDLKFRALSEQCTRQAAPARLHIAPGVGHNVLLEDPDFVARVISGAPG